MEKIQIFDTSHFEQTITVENVIINVALMWLPMVEKYLFSCSSNGVDIVSGVQVVPFSPLISISALQRIPELKGNFFCIPEDSDAQAEFLAIDYENLTSGRFAIYYIGSAEAAEVL